MSAETVSVPVSRADGAPGGSWVNRLIDLVEGLPGPPTLAYLVALPVTVVLVATTDWANGAPVGQIGPTRVVWAVALVGTVWLIHHLDGVARSAFADFQPSLAAPPGEIARLLDELTVIPARPAWILLGLSALRTTEGLLFQPASEDALGLTPLAFGIRWVFETVLSGLIAVLVYHTFRQLRLVNRLHAGATHLSLLRPAPLYAFSRLTAQTAIGLILLSVPFWVTNLPSSQTTLDYVSTLTFVAALIVSGIVAFLAPLLGMHRRMAAEKRRLQTEVGGRIEALIAELHEAVDERQLGAADVQNKTLASLLAERELVNRLTTWPWQAGTVGAVVSAVVLPIILWLVTRLFERVV